MLCGNLGFLSAADDLSAFRDERSPQLARVRVKLLLKLTHAGLSRHGEERLKNRLIAFVTIYVVIAVLLGLIVWLTMGNHCGNPK